MPTRSAAGHPDQSGAPWRDLAVFAGGAEHQDGALEHAVGPAIRSHLAERPGGHWYFTRWVDQRGPHLRLSVSGGEVDALVDQIARGLRVDLAGDDAREPVLPPPASRRRGSRHVGVQAAEHRSERERFGAGLEDAQALFEVSSNVVLDALPSLPGGTERAAYGLALMIVLGDVGLGHDEQRRFWEHVAARWTGSGDSARKVLDRVAGHARALGPELRATARDVRGRDSAGTALERYEQGCERALASAADDGARAELVCHHAHLTNNRLGVNPLEAILLASVLAGGRERTAVRSAVPADPASDPPADLKADPLAGAGDQPAEAVRFEEVSKEDGGSSILDGVSLVVHPGEVFGLVGPDGAGKSSLLGIAAGLRVASGGTVRVLGADPLADRRRLAPDIGVPLPDDELAASRSVRENLELRSPPGGARADVVLESIGLRDRAADAIADLGRSERRRVALGCALMGEPGVVFLDGPTADLSAVEREEVWAVLRSLSAGGTTVILATTSLQEMRSVCDRAALMLAGRVVDVAEPEELAEHHFSPRSVHFRTTDEPDLALLRDLPEVTAVEIDPRPDHFAIEVTTLQPDELLRVVGNDPEFPEVVSVAVDDLEATFYTHAQSATCDPTPGG